MTFHLRLPRGHSTLDGEELRRRESGASADLGARGGGRCGGLDGDKRERDLLIADGQGEVGAVVEEGPNLQSFTV